MGKQMKGAHLQVGVKHQRLKLVVVDVHVIEEAPLILVLGDEHVLEEAPLSLVGWDPPI